MAPEIITALVGLLCSIISSSVTFVFTKRKYTAEVESQQIKNISEAFDAYKKVVEETIDSQNAKITYLQEENTRLKKSVDQLQSQMVNFLMEKVERKSTKRK